MTNVPCWCATSSCPSHARRHASCSSRLDTRGAMRATVYRWRQIPAPRTARESSTMRSTGLLSTPSTSRSLCPAPSLGWLELPLERGSVGPNAARMVCNQPALRLEVALAEARCSEPPNTQLARPRSLSETRAVAGPTITAAGSSGAAERCAETHSHHRAVWTARQVQYTEIKGRTRSSGRGRRVIPRSRALVARRRLVADGQAEAFVELEPSSYGRSDIFRVL